MSGTTRVLVLGDVVGQPGCRTLFVCLRSIVRETRAELVVVNGENASGGYGLAPDTAQWLFQIGVDVITSGNHIWENKDMRDLLDLESALLRPENYPEGAPGVGHCVLRTKRGVQVAVLNIEGRVHLSDLRCPFRVGAHVASSLRSQTSVIVVDFHAESVEEKEALAWHLDGRVSAVVGTHTHVQTADERILRKGTGYITDIGMTGPLEGIIGMRKETAIRRTLTQMPLKSEIEEGPTAVMGILLEIDTGSGRTISMQRIVEKLPATVCE